MAPTKNPKVRPAEMTAVPPMHHPSIGGGYAYSHEFREFSLLVRAEGRENDPIFTQLRDQHKFPSEQTIDRWEARLETFGHIRRFERQGNNPATVLRGMDNYMLALWRSIWPKATIAEVNALLFKSQVERGEEYPRFFDPSQICRAEDRLGLGRKRGSTTAYQAMLPRNLMKRWMYWHLNYPYGIADIPKDDWIDIDEAAVFVETANRSHGKAYIGFRVREEGPYNHSEKYVLTMAIAGDINGDRWLDFEKKKALPLETFLHL